MKRYRLTIQGKVQGVWFRGAALRKAQELGLSGFIKNMPNGSVYAEAEGEDETLAAFVTWCQNGPELAEVERITMEEAEPEHRSGFEIRR